MNKKIFLILYTITQKNKYLSNTAVFVTTVSKALYFFVYLIYGAAIAFAGNLLIVPYILIPAAALLSVRLLRSLLRVQRPFKELEIQSLIKHEDVYSFPSNHAAAASVIACVVYQVDRAVGIVLLSLSVITGVSRILTGVHYPLDVLCGWIIGFLFGGLFILIGC